MALKDAWDRHLKVEESKSENWEDGVSKYVVVRHHFTEALLRAQVKAKKDWHWREPVTQEEAKKLLWQLKKRQTLLASQTRRRDF